MLDGLARQEEARGDLAIGEPFAEQSQHLEFTLGQQTEPSRARASRPDPERAQQGGRQIGDDRLQMRARGYVSPESFTHGSAAQRSRWFRRGLESGSTKSCDTFKAAQL